MELFNQAYSQKTYLDFLADKFTFAKGLVAIQIENTQVKSFSKLGQISTAGNKVLPIFEIHISPNTQLARNRVQLRNLVAKQISAEDGALAVYVDEQNQQWRFSFIAIEYNFTDDGLTKTQTASKRFTYLLGVGAQTRTATERFSKLNRHSTLDDLKTAFAVEALNKEFYDKLYRWYERAQKQVVFPNDEGAENHTETSLIRLLTRLLFIWFLKEKKLINADLFNREKLATLIDYDKPSSFYKAILQNLFFATLNVEISERIFRANKSFKGKNKDYGNQYRYRYHNLVKNEKKWQDLFSQTPFLNGGLFESSDRRLEEYLKDGKGNKIINAQDKRLIDNWNKNVRPEKNMLRAEGFSEHNDNPLTLENSLFFNNENDLGLIDIFNQYQFTVEESTPLDIEVALDPELLGKVFENLLASYNPETGGQARKATGSFYTPREIVSYMVDESLKQHFKTHTDLANEQINALFIESENTLNNNQIKTVINAIDNLKILDPAVGSGAYPMGILQRLVFILEKIDPKNTHFKQQQIDKAELMDEASKKASIEAIEKVFDQANQHNTYGKKLMLIENCIYGVDIQPIAILISQLRFFISLTIEQKTNADKDKNFGIQPLPNLDYHFEVGNSLIGIPKDYSTQSIKDLLIAIKPLKHRFFTEANHDEKKKLKQKIDDKIKTCYQKMADAIGYTIDFDFKIDFSEMFESQDGFDIVLGNPPYIRQESIKELKPQFQRDYQVFTGTADIYTYFYEKGFNLLNANGHLCYITSNKWMRAKYGENLRDFFKTKTQLKQIIDFEGEQIFENATVDTNILLCGKTSDDKNFTYQKQLPDGENPLFTMPIADLSTNAYTLQPPALLALKKKIEQIGTPLKEWDINIYRGVVTGFNQAFIIDTVKKDELIKADPKSAEIIKPILRGRDIKAYEHHWAGLWIILAKYQSNKYLQIKYPAIYNHLLKYKEKLQKRGQCRYGGKGNQGQHHWLELDNNPSDTYLAEFEKEKIVWTPVNSEYRFTFLAKKEYFNNSIFMMTSDSYNLKYLIAILNSDFIQRIGFILFTNLLTSGVYAYGSKEKMEQLPIPKIPKPAQQPFIKLVEQILTAKQIAQPTTTLEAEIDKMVYKLYNLTADEIKIIEDKK